jgi:hypothetical protein
VVSRPAPHEEIREDAGLLGRVRRHVNVTVSLLVAALCVVLGFATGFWLLFRLAYVILIAIPLAWLWTREMAKGLEVQVQRTDQRVTQGQPIEGRVTIQSLINISEPTRPLYSSDAVFFF